MPHFQQQTGRGEGPFCIDEWGSAAVPHGLLTPPAAACRSARLVGFAHKPQFNTESPTVRK